MTKEEITIAAQKEFAHQIEIGSKAPLSVQEGFINGAEWMQERMIEKAVKWLRGEMYYRDESSGRVCWGKIETFWAYDSLDEFINDFKQAMQDENKDI